MKAIDEWAANKCGVETFKAQIEGPLLWTMPNGCVREWIIKDPRCREILREHYQITTEYYCGKWIALRSNGVEKPPDMGCNETIEEAEIACITAIYEEEK